MFGQVALGKDLLRVQHEVTQQAEFGSGQLDINPFAAHALAAFVQVQSGSFEPGLVGKAPRPAQQRLNAQLQLFGVEGLAQIVVRSRLQSLDALGP
ncbi:hypothetical protein D3C81_1850210 [compost metagenome]